MHCRIILLSNKKYDRIKENINGILFHHQLIDIGGVLADADGQTALELVMKAKKALIDPGLFARVFNSRGDFGKKKEPTKVYNRFFKA
ncbi:MAG: hypothetical protein WCC17_14425 [Candidatus Nitrosopolaris sp.]